MCLQSLVLKALTAYTRQLAANTCQSPRCARSPWPSKGWKPYAPIGSQQVPEPEVCLQSLALKALTAYTRQLAANTCQSPQVCLHSLPLNALTAYTPSIGSPYLPEPQLCA